MVLIAIPFDEPLHCYSTRLQFLDCSVEMSEYRVCGPRGIELIYDAN